MSSFGTRILGIWFFFHFFFIIAFALRDAASVLPGDSSLFPRSSDPFWRLTETATSAICGESLPSSNLLRQCLAAYGNGTGIETGYSYFAPSVPGSCKLVFELHYPDGHIEYDVPHVAGAAAGYRLTTLIDSVARFRYVPLQEALLKLLVYANWQKHPNATMIRAAFGVVRLPTLAEFTAGKRRSYDVLYSAEFRFNPTPDKSLAP